MALPSNPKVKDIILGIKALETSKQDTLVSGTNIKTINGNSILGSGDLSVGGGSTITSVDGLAGGTLTSTLVMTGGSASDKANIKLDNSANGQIIDNSNYTIFGFRNNETNNLYVGRNTYGLKFRGSGTRPQFNGNNIALLSDAKITNSIPSSSSANTNGYVKYPDGTMICFGKTTSSSSSTKTATFAASFLTDTKPYIVATIQTDVTSGVQQRTLVIGADSSFVSNTAVTFAFSIATSYTAHYIAIGKWK